VCPSGFTNSTSCSCSVRSAWECADAPLLVCRGLVIAFVAYVYLILIGICNCVRAPICTPIRPIGSLVIFLK